MGNERKHVQLPWCMGAVSTPRCRLCQCPHMHRLRGSQCRGTRMSKSGKLGAVCTSACEHRLAWWVGVGGLMHAVWLGARSGWSTLCGMKQGRRLCRILFAGRGALRRVMAPGLPPYRGWERALGGVVDGVGAHRGETRGGDNTKAGWTPSRLRGGRTATHNSPGGHQQPGQHTWANYAPH